MKKILQKGEYADLVVEYLSDRSQVFNVRVYPLPRKTPEYPHSSGVELLAKDEATAQKLFNMIEESCVGITDC